MPILLYSTNNSHCCLYDVILILTIYTVALTVTMPYQHFGGTCCLHLQGRWEEYAPPKQWKILTTLQDVITLTAKMWNSYYLLTLNMVDLKKVTIIP
jgi:hypothetical protein